MPRIHLVQSELIWEEPAANRAMFTDKMADLNDSVIALPEMFSTGFTMASSRLAETIQQATATWLADTALARKAPICGSMIIADNHQYYNRFIWSDAAGRQTCYDKRHLFRMAQEHHFFQPGEHRVVINHDQLRILPQICYDLRFPVWSRNRGDYDVLLFVANWPAARQGQWLALLKARAIENLCYVVAVNRVGEDGNGINYEGGSCVIGPDGEYLVPPMQGEQIVAFEPDLDDLEAYRQAFPAFLDSDSFQLKDAPA